jgi:tRNA threonylcarbamoyladenosine biosynthesis protein TsaE
LIARGGFEAPHASPYNTPRVLHVSHSVAQTESFAAAFAQALRGGECVALSGELGAGKTQFVRGLVRGLRGNPHAVSSPSFVLLNVYDTGRLKVFHLDAYRVGGAEDFDAIGFNELLEQGGVVVVEWADRVKELLPTNCAHIAIRATGKHTREIKIDAAFPSPCTRGEGPGEGS